MTNILVIETNQDFAGEIRDELGRLECTVQLHEDPGSGLLAATKSRPDLILLSVELPGTNGFSVCNKIKKSALREIPVILMSSESSQQTFERHQ